MGKEKELNAGNCNTSNIFLGTNTEMSFYNVSYKKK